MPYYNITAYKDNWIDNHNCVFWAFTETSVTLTHYYGKNRKNAIKATAKNVTDVDKAIAALKKHIKVNKKSISTLDNCISYIDNITM